MNEKDSNSLTIRVNGTDHRMFISAERTLLEVLREEMDLVGAREGCGIGMCGACTVLVNGRAMSSCLLLAAQAEGKDILTIEGLGDDEKLHPVQQAFIEHAAFQCAYCTSGFILSTVALLDEQPAPGDDEIRENLAGVLCRCGSYANVLEAVKACGKTDR